MRARKHLRGRCARSAHDLARQVPSSQPDKQRVEIVLDGLLVHRHAASFALASLLAVLQLQFGFRDAPLDLRLPESAPRQLFFGVRTLLRFGRVRFVCVHRRRKYRSARAGGLSARTAGVARATCGIHHAQNAASSFVRSFVSGPSRPDTHPQAPKRRAWEALTQTHFTHPCSLPLNLEVRSEPKSQLLKLLLCHINASVHVHVKLPI